MITGQNTEVRHANQIFHVQTEDKGVQNPVIESLLYLGGQVLANARTSYADALAEGQGEDEIAVLIDRQHRTMIAALLRGRFDDKISGTTTPEGVSAADSVSTECLDAESLAAELVAREDLSLDELVLDYLRVREEGDPLTLSLAEVDLVLGREVDLEIGVVTAKSTIGVSECTLEVKLICSARRPRILGLGRSDKGGRAIIRIRLPDEVEGAAAIIVTAASPLGRTELKRLLT